MQEDFDVIIIGSGPAGYVCAIRAAQLGLKTAVAEKDNTLGGTCLNVGCIPSKALLSASAKYEESKKDFGKMGIKIQGASVNIKDMMSFKDEVVADNTKGISFLFKKNKITHIVGTAKITSEGTVKIGSKTYTAKNIVIATGSESTPLPNIDIDEKKIVTSTGALSLSKTPKKMTVIGGGVIGLELGAVWHRLGAEVEVIEFLDEILPGMDGEIRKHTRKIMTKQGIKFTLGTKVLGALATKQGVNVAIEPASGGESKVIKTNIVLLSIGRRPYVKGLGLKKLGVEFTKTGQIATNGNYATNINGIYAIGDVREGPMLAHKSEEEGVAVAEILAGKIGHVNYDIIPSIIYTEPEIAQVGKTEEELKEEGIKYNIGKFPYMANGRARAMDKTEGFVKILADAKTDEILGGHIIGHEAGTLIAEIAAVMEFSGTAEDIARTCHAHPTLSEIVKEAALAVDKRALHI